MNKNLIIIVDAKDGKLTLSEGVFCTVCKQFLCPNNLPDDERVQIAVDHKCPAASRKESDGKGKGVNYHSPSEGEQDST